MRSWTRRSRIAISSACCSLADSPAFDGQSMLSTVATHTARSSRATGGGSDWARSGAAPARVSRAAARRAMRDDVKAGRCEGGKGTYERLVAPDRRHGFVLYSARHHTILPHRWETEDAPIDAEIARRTLLPPEVARHRFAHHLFPRLRLAILVDGAHRRV